MEDGEVREDRAETAYDPALEWPGGESTPQNLEYTSHIHASFQPYDSSMTPVRTNQDPSYPLTPSYASSSTPPARSSLRLIRVLPEDAEGLRQAHTILPRTQTLAIIDGYSQVQFGRDAAPVGNDTPRIRLKEMEVSKLHATIYWDEDRSEWAIVDMGSKHGTYVRPSVASSAPGSNAFADSRGHRLSPPRMSSIPRPLKHLDEVSLGTTTFTLHIHIDHLPCDECASTGGDEIALFKAVKADTDASRKRKREDIETPPAPRVDSRKSLALLKRSLLWQHSEPQPPITKSSEDKRAYLDRSARRRALHPTTHDPPGIASPFSSKATTPSATPRSITPPAEPVSEPPAPLPSSNVGHRLLMKQGWVPGSVLGSAQDNGDQSGESIALAEPIQVSVRAARSGLGVVVPEQPPTVPPQAGLSWQEEAKRRRWAELAQATGR